MGLQSLSKSKDLLTTMQKDIIADFEQALSLE